MCSINEHKEKQDLSLIDKAFQSAARGEKQVLLAKFGIHLQKLNPSFDARAYGYSNLSEYLKAHDGYSLIDNNVNGYNHPIVIKKNSSQHSINIMRGSEFADKGSNEG